MKRMRHVLAAMFVVALAWGASGVARVHSRLVSPLAAQEEEQQTVSGKVTGVGEDSVAVEVVEETDEGEETKIMNFVIDDNTDVEGQLEVGARVRVTYRVAEGRNIAIRVVVLD